MEQPNPLEGLIDRFVRLEGFPAGIEMHQKIDVLEYVLAKLKYERRHSAEQVTFEEFERCHVVADTGCIVVTANQNASVRTPPIAPLRLQAPLLIFLLLHHQARFQVLEIITLFIGEIRNSLTFPDFKKTQTGVTRCFTNTRFAATRLRDCGLLKFTRREAFKTWELSFFGLIVAAHLYRTRQSDGCSSTVPAPESLTSFGLHGEVYRALNEVSSFEAFLGELRFLCTDETKVFATFEPVLKEAHRLFLKHQALLNNADITKRERGAAVANCMAQLETLPFIDAFYDELALSLRIDELLTEGTKR
jgi:hypothetical protein